MYVIFFFPPPLNQFEIGKRGAVKTTILGRKNLYISRALYVSHTQRKKASKKFLPATKALSILILEILPSFSRENHDAQFCLAAKYTIE